MYIHLIMKKKDRENLAKFASEGPFCTCFYMRRASRAVTHLYDDIAKPTGLRATQLSILGVLYVLGSKPISQLAEMIVMDRTTMTRDLKPLERRGLVEIKSGEDRRVRVVSLTEKGREVLAKFYPLWKRAQSHFVDGLGQDDWGELLTLLRQTVSVAAA